MNYDDDKVDYRLLEKLKNSKDTITEDQIIDRLTSLKNLMISLNSAILQLQDNLNQVNVERAKMFTEYSKLAQMVATLYKNSVKH